MQTHYIKTVFCVVVLICIVNGFDVYSQSIISGKVQNNTKKLLPDIPVTILKKSDSTVVAYTITDHNGNYLISYSGKESRLLISIRGLNIKHQIKEIENQTQIVNFITEEGRIFLREIEVKSTKIWGNRDTVNYLVSSFKNKTDVVLGDVLKKMPGIEVAESGQINYKGVPINKFYIENMDLLHGRYGIATNNISADDISTVQVLENHQPIKALENTRFVDAASINLKIKQGRKGIFSMMATLGLGIDDDMLWKEEVTGMYFGKQRQHLATYKTNNNGTDIVKELKSFSTETTTDDLQITHLQQPTPPDIRFERYNFNNTNATTLNNLWKLENDATMNLNVTYYHNKETRQSFERTSYLLPDNGSFAITENISSLSVSNHIDGQFRYTFNKNSCYFNNYLNVAGEWNDGKGYVQTDQNIRQMQSNNAFGVNHILHFIKRGDEGRGCEFLSKNSFRTQPQHLTIMPGLYPEFLNDSLKYAALIQKIRYNTFVSNNRFSLLSAVVVGDVHLNPTVNLNMERQYLHSGLDVIGNDASVKSITNYETQNSISLMRIYAGTSFDVNYHSNRWQVNVVFPLTYRHTFLDNSLISNAHQQAGQIYFLPSFTAKYSITNRWTINAEGSFYKQMPNLQTLYTGYILQTYRNINRYETCLADKNNGAVLFGISYKDILNMFFAGGSISLIRYHSNALYGQTFDGFLTLTQFYYQPNSGNSVSVNGRVSKAFDWKKLMIAANINWRESRSNQLRQSCFINYYGEYYSANLSGNMNPTKWLAAEYRAQWECITSRISTGKNFQAIQSINQRIKVTASLPLDINLNASLEHYCNNREQGGQSFSLADVGLSMGHKNMLYSLEWTNILNTSQYVSTSYDAMNAYYSEYNIRPTAVMFTVRFKLL